MLQKCLATGKVVFASYLEAHIVMFNLKWGYKKHKDIHGKRIKHRQGKPEQKRAYFCTYCNGYHLTKWNANDFNIYSERSVSGDLS